MGENQRSNKRNHPGRDLGGGGMEHNLGGEKNPC